MIKFKNENATLIVEFDGNKLQNCESICNTLRRILLCDITSYAFNSKNTSIDENTSILNNDIIKHRLELFPIQSFDEKNDKSINSVLFLNKENETNENIDVTSNDFIIKINEKRNDKIFKSLEDPIILCHLRPGQKLQLTSQLESGTAKEHDMYSVCHSYFSETNNIYSLYIEPNGIYTSKELFKFACNIYIEKLNSLNEFISKNEDSDKNIIDIIINDNNYTIAYLFVLHIQQLDETKYAACNLPHLSENNIRINIILKNNNTIKDICNKVILKIQNLFKSFIKNM